jgi:KipI family sensor histidine kinase inhibitor
VSPPRIREAGDSALLLQLEEAIDPAVNARAIAIANAVRRRAPAGVLDVVSTFRSVAVYFDPLAVEVDALREALTASLGAPADLAAGKTVVIPVQYGGDVGPDLDNVAAFAGVSAERVAEIHSSRDYRVFMLGFLPGFPYLASVDETIAAPRRASPRLLVRAGSVGIAGRQTGIYPQDSPGGWQIIGGTMERIFDPSRSTPSLLAPGDSVRFEPAISASRKEPRSGAERIAAAPADDGRYATVIRPGLLTTIQDAGRWGQQAHGVPVSGPMDRVSHRVANALVGNEPSAAALEVTLVGPEIRLDTGAIVALAGADLDARLDDEGLPLHRPVQCRPGSVIRFGERRSGTRAYLAFSGGIGVPPVLGSRATHTRCRLGGVNGRAIAAGDRLPLVVPAGVSAWQVIDIPSARVRAGARLRVLPGPHDEYFPERALDVLQQTRFTVTSHSDRMGYRLSGGRLATIERGEMISDAAFTGALQVPPSGDPILLMADRQTTGGYPQIATVISADLPLAGQLAPGDWVEFRMCTRHEALSALIAQEGALRALR